MRVDCLHGYFKFTEERAGQVSHFASLFGFELEQVDDHFTFSDLAEAPRYSIAGNPCLGVLATATFEGEPWEVMRANGLVYDFTIGRVVPIETVFQSAELIQSGNYLVSSGMLLPGTLMEDGERVTDYAAHFEPTRMNFKYSEVTSE